MASITVKIDQEQLQKWLGKMPEKMTNALGRIIQTASLLVERHGKILAPVDTGRLRNSIASEILPMRAEVSTHVFYASFVHDGTRYITGRPFMKEAMDITGQEMPTIVDREIKNALE